MHKYKRPVITFLKFSVAIGAIIYLISSGKLDPRVISFQQDRIEYIAYTFLLIFSIHVTASLRWYFLLRQQDINIPVKDGIRMSFIGIFFNTFMLGGLGGDVIKMAYIAKETDKRSGAAAAIVLDRTCGLMGVLTVGAIAIFIGWEEVSNNPRLQTLAIIIFGVLSTTMLSLASAVISVLKKRGIALLFVGIILIAEEIFVKAENFSGTALENIITVKIAFLAACIFSLLSAIITPSILPGGGLNKFVKEKVPLGTPLISFTNSLLAFRKNPFTLLFTFIISIIIQTMCTLSIASLGYAIGNAALTSHVFFAAPPTFLANTLPVPMGGLGIGETCYDSLLSFCINPQTGKAITGGAIVFLSWRIALNIVNTAVGLPAYLTNKKEIKDIQKSSGANE
jgi:hypothetical protein